MYVIKHIPTKTIFGIHPSTRAKISICVFTNNNHATRVADNIARYRYAQNEFPASALDYKKLFKTKEESIYDCEFTPFNENISFTSYDLCIEPMFDLECLEYCSASNLDIVFCILNDKSFIGNEFVYLPLQNTKGNDEFLDECFKKH
uniref:Uncharacterized protein n=1 Tax=Pyramimonas orientalis virus TaxID=455367 RepID=A0A7M3UPA8_POV01|nr:hypothetical protein HWQ62_00454 [Pyramimonas orientalis virus]